MKQYQSNYTTPEQGKRLLELGVPADSADMHYFDFGEGFIQLPDLNEGDEDFELDIFFPCWTVGRLEEIYEIIGENAGQCISTNKHISRTESLVQLYEENATLLDFSKLEE